MQIQYNSTSSRISQSSFLCQVDKNSRENESGFDINRIEALQQCGSDPLFHKHVIELNIWEVTNTTWPIFWLLALGIK